MTHRPYDLIAKKRDGGEHTEEEIRALVTAVVDGSMPNYQVSAWLMAAFLRGLSAQETLALTLAMRDSGEVVRLDDIPGIKVDKHSSGGVGDKTSLVVVPLLAAAGVPMLKMSGRGLGFSGGTIDKLESIPGFHADLSVEDARKQVRTVGAAIIRQSPKLVPADMRMYALRDVTATVESIPLIAASIMSKKLAGGADAVLLDVKVGRGAFMKNMDNARELARTMVEIGDGAGVRTVAALTAMDEPLGYAVGNALEVKEACAALTGDGRVEARFLELCLRLAARGLVLAERAQDDSEGRAMAEGILRSGKAAAKLVEIIEAQRGNPEIVRNPELLPRAPVVHPVMAGHQGFVQTVDAELIGRLARQLGAGRVKKEDSIDPAAGILLMRKSGDSLEAGDILAEMHCGDEMLAEPLAESLAGAFNISKSKPQERPIVYEFIE